MSQSYDIFDESAETKQGIMAGLQAIITQLGQQADGHELEAIILGNKGYTALQQKYVEHAAEERGWIDKCANRLMDLGGTVKLEDKKGAEVSEDPVEWIKYDRQVSIDGLAGLAKLVELARQDYTTFDMLKAYYEDEEQDLYWADQQLELIEKLGREEWLYRQL